ncbi:MAG TPA: glycosyltransferase [bacterium]|nr:glycosyltransferase [bacterium]
MNASPLVSLILPAYNAERHIGAAIQSILSQSFAEFELIIIDDGSTDDTVGVTSRFNDQRIRVLGNDGNRGIVFSLNRGIEEARGCYMARMDADDIARPERLMRQFTFMEDHPAVGLCGSWAQKFIAYGPRWTQRAQTSSAELKASLLFATPFVHPTVMIRRSVMDAHDLRYRDEFPAVEDYRLWCEMALVTELAVIPEVLLDYRVSLSSVTGAVYLDGKRLNDRREILLKLWSDYIEKTLGFTPNRERLDAHACFYDLRFARVSPDKVGAAHRWLDFLQQANGERKFFDGAALATVCNDVGRSLDVFSPADVARRILISLLGK